MGQKVHPHGMRVGVIKDWDSRWYARADKVSELIIEDFKIREYLKKTLYSAGVPRIEIERDSAKVRIFIHCSRPGVVIGKGGSEIEKLRQTVEKMIGKPVALSIVEVRTPDTNAQLVAENIASQLERRIGFRRAMKNAMGRAMRMGARGIKVMVSGRLGGAEIARSENYHEGTIPLQTIRADIEYGFAEADTTYGKIGVKVWIYKGEVLSQTLRSTPRTMDMSRRDEKRGDRRRNDRRGGSGRDNRGGYQNRGPQGSSQGGYQNRSPQGSSQGGYQNRGNQGSSQGGFQNRGNQGSSQGGFQNRGNQGSSQGGFQNRGNQGPSQGGFQNRDNKRSPGQSQGGTRPASAPRPAADKPTEGGNT